MPRVAMVIQRYLPHLGGAEKQLNQLAPRLQRRGYEPIVLTRHEQGLAPYQVIDGVPVHRLPSTGPKALAGATFTASAVAKLTQLHPDLVHAHEILSPASIAVLSKRINHHPVLVKILRGGGRGDIYKLKKRPFWKSYFQSLKRNVDAFLVISQEIDAELAALGVPREKRVFLPNGVNTERCTPVSEERKRKLRNELSLPAEATLVAYVGRLVPEKRVDHLLRLWPQIQSNDPAARLLIVGEGSEESRLKSMSVDGTQFTGQVSDAVPYLQTADLFVLPSSTEGLSNSMLEAMSCGLPVLATTVGGAPDVIKHGSSGFLIPPDDLDSLQRGLQTLIDDRMLRFTLGSNARARILADFSLDSVADRLVGLYDQILHPQ
ncbi:MAG TPA: glycosyltransferase family 4 protein [Anaerolineales bacterium]|nr:glycosyltransferase family 4 protein [Anaerolineales bacterium]